MTRAARVAAGLGCAVAAGASLGSCSPDSPAPARPARTDFKVGLELRGETGDRTMLACSGVQDYAQFPSGRRIRYDGIVTPTPKGKWRVKVKIKRCISGQFQDSGADRVPGVSGGRFAGYIQPPGKGLYFARARYRDRKGDVISRKEYFQVR